MRPSSFYAGVMSSIVQLVDAPTLADAPYAYAATAPAASRLVFLAGACPLNDDGLIEHPGDYAAQAARCVETMLGALDAAGCTLEDGYQHPRFGGLFGAL